MNPASTARAAAAAESDPAHDAGAAAALAAAGLSGEASAAWLANRPAASGDYRTDVAAFGRTWRLGLDLLAALPNKPSRNAAQASAAALIHRMDRAARDAFLIAHVEALYRALTKNLAAFVRVENLVYDAAIQVPGLVPTRAEVERESLLDQSAKEGREIDQGILLSRVFAHEPAGVHLCHAMLLPRPEAWDLLARLRERGRIDLGAASVERRGKAAIVTLRNPRFLNAEDTGTIADQETAADLAILDPASDIAVLRGDVVEHPNYRGRRLFSAGLNLTHLYRGKIPFVWYITRDMGFVNKLMRGVAKPDLAPEDPAGGSIEKPWIAAVDGFAIGGGCQILLAVDYVLAASDAYMTLPARKEGIIPGCANLRLPRFVGDRIARQAIMYGRRLDCDSPEGRLICDEVVPPHEMDAALARVIDGMTSSGVVSACGNRRAFRVGQEPLDLFRRYMAAYVREQAYCHFSPALIANLERHWNAQQRRE
ncbi:MAG TPA: enoyl-CoA hydratase/isomerase family protein [Xanthobacteraceae bacterium]|nr:enoyl-CoA hydratase/isomerase family protein [Xanthobacteraceae bacterium]